MVSDGQKLTAVWAEHNDALMVMVLGSLADMSVNIHWNHRPEVTQGLIVESSFALPPIAANVSLRMANATLS